MHITRPNEASKDPRVGSLSVRTMHPLSPQETIIISVPQPLGVPLSAFKLILDFDLRRKRTANFARAWRKEDDVQLYGRLASLRRPGWKFNTDPIFWVLRVRWEIRKATLSHDALQSGEKLHYSPAVSVGASETSPIYKALAAWLVRSSRLQQRDFELCRGIYDETRSRGSADTLSEYKACHWFLWYSVAGGIPRSKAWEIARKANLF